MVKNHLKRINAPKTWDVHRKRSKFITRPNPGAHRSILSIPLSVLLIENLGIFDNKKEARYAFTRKTVLVNGKPAIDPAFGVGLLDSISLPLMKKHYRLVIDEREKLSLVEIPEKEAGLLLVKVTGKRSLAKDKVQLSTTAGKNILLKKTELKTGSSLLLEMPGNKIVKELRFEEGMAAYVFEGRHKGRIVRIKKILEDKIVFEEGKTEAETKRGYVIIVGKDKPEITIIK